MAQAAGDEPEGHGGDHGADVDCGAAVRELYHFLDGELTEERRRAISVHLDGCGPCAGAVGFETELRVVISSRCRDRVPQSLIDRVAAAIHAEQRAAGRRPKAPPSLG